jgi:phosphoserine phosphatase RsbU/P
MIMATLVLLQDGQALPHELTGEEATLGRHPECTVVLNSNMISRKHARVFRDGSGWMVEDLGSGNGTFVNGKKIEGPTVLGHEDRIKLGPLLVRFESGMVANPKAPTAGFGGEMTIGMGIDLDDDMADAATVMNSTEAVAGFGNLEVRPEAKLKAVLEISQSLAGTVDLDAILPKILDTLFKVFPHADRACILFQDTAGKMIPKAVKHRRSGDDETVKVSRTILKTVLEQKKGVLSADAMNDSQFQASESISNLAIRSMMCVPMLSLAGDPMGAIHIDTQNAFNQFKAEDLDLLVAVAGQAAMSYESAKLMVTALEKLKQDREMDIAMNVQRALLPTELPQSLGWEFFASYDTAQAVGGDYYDVLPLAKGTKVCIAFGDVAGKGVPASLVMSRLSSVVANVVEFLDDVSAAACRINNQMCAKAVEGRFVTFVLGLIDVKSGKLKFVNAGHMPIMVRKTDGTLVEIGADEVGIPIGVMEDFPYDVVEYTIQPGETAVIYTDGVSEAMNPAGDLFGVEKIREMVKASRAGAAEELGKQILAEVRKHANGRPQNDDITIMVFGRKA